MKGKDYGLQRLSVRKGKGNRARRGPLPAYAQLPIDLIATKAPSMARRPATMPNPAKM